MIEVTVQDLLEFVKSQDPDKIIDMMANYYNTECGCLMVQYGKEKFPDVKFNGCGTASWFVDNTERVTPASVAVASIVYRSKPISIFSIIPISHNEITFADAQKCIENFLLLNPEN